MTQIPAHPILRTKLRQLSHQILRQSFPHFVRRVFQTVSPGTVYEHNWHIELICAHLEACARGDITRLIINMPPRMLKSITVSVAWPAWLLGHFPNKRIMVASYAQSLSIKHSVDTRLVMQSAWYQALFAHTKISRDQNEKDKFVTTARGHRIAVSVGSAATGEGGDILIVDDPLNPLQAMQHSARSHANNWFDHTFVSRLNNKKTGAIILVMQRLHADDLSGYLLRKGGWHHLCLPAIAPETSEYHMGNFHYTRQKGALLQPAREDAVLLKRAESELGSSHFAAQYQQQPIAESSAMLKREWFKRFTYEDGFMGADDASHKDGETL
jgi:hypothetical protein